jgi:hypothetical protein
MQPGELEMRAIITPLLALLLLAPACSRPSQQDCENAVDHIRELYGTAEDEAGVGRAAAIRSCRGNADKDSVDCVLAARTKEDLANCEGELTKDLFPDEPPESNETEGEPAQPAPGAEPAQPAPGAEPAQPAPGAEPAQPAPGAEPAQPAPGAEPAQPAPGAEPAQPAPGGSGE